MEEILQMLNDAELDQMIYHLERGELDETTPNLDTPIWGEMEGIPFYRVKGQASYWHSSSLVGYDNAMGDLITSLYGQRDDFYFLLLGDHNRVGLYVGTSSGSPTQSLLPLLASSFPGVQVDPTEDARIGSRLEKSGFLKFRGVLSGIPPIPRPKGAGAGQIGDDEKRLPTEALRPLASASLERMIRGLHGSQWGFFLHAIPNAQTETTSALNGLLAAIQSLQSRMRLQMQKVNQSLTKVSEITQAGETKSVSVEMINRKAEYTLTRLEHQVKRFQQIRSEGGWLVDVHFFSPSEQTVMRMEYLLRSVFVSGENHLEPVRTFRCRPAGQRNLPSFSTLLASEEVARFAYFPREEFPGFQIRDFTLFDVDQKVYSSKECIALGNILEHGHDTLLQYSIPLENLSQHVLVTGVTGSGKTTTILKFLDLLAQKDGRPGIPFLIIEPTKSEYRAVIGSPAGSGAIPKARVFTLGDETVSPFRLNPFQFEILDKDNFTHVQTHIDYLKSVFLAAFVLYPPMPYVLEICLHEIYEDRGWNLTTSRNERIPEDHWGKPGEWPVFPTLTDLHEKIDAVTERLGYDQQIKMDVKAALQTRIRSLMIGGKGLMLNTAFGQNMVKLLEEPAILELDRIGDDEEKVFLMGLLLARLFECRRLEYLKANHPLPFRHLTVIEEAHRLLRAVPLQTGPDQSNPRGQAVETFSNLLSEIRAYGEGLLIAEQIPGKLAPDVLKNTSLKIMHRIVAEDDRRSLSAATNMSEAQSKYLVVMPPGEVAVFNQGDDHPLLVKITPSEKINIATRPPDAELRRKEPPLWIGDSLRLVSWTRTPGREARSKAIAMQILAHPDYETAWCETHLRMLRAKDNPQAILEPFENLVGRFLGPEGELMKPVLAYVILEGSQQEYYRRGKVYGWNYLETSEFHKQSLECLAALLQKRNEEGVDRILTLFLAMHTRSRMSQGPYPGCALCHERCTYQYDLIPLARDAILKQEWKDIILDPHFSQQSYKELAHIVWNLLDQASGGRTANCARTAAEKGLALCLSVQLLNQLGVSSRYQVRILGSIHAVLEEAGSEQR